MKPKGYAKNLIDKTTFRLREIKATFEKPILLWAGGKDSTVLLHLAKMAFLGEIPFPVVFIDTGWQFTETYNFIKRIRKMWKVPLVVIENRKAKMEGVSPETHSKMECCTRLKTDALIEYIKKENIDCVVEAIRASENIVRAKAGLWQEYLNPLHVRWYPIFEWSEGDVWNYIRAYNVPYNPLYDYKMEGKIYRSIGCYPCTNPCYPEEGERAGRDLDKEHLMEQLRRMGYM